MFCVFFIVKGGKAELLRKLKKQDHGVKKEVDHLKKLKDELKKQVDELKKVKNELKQNTDQLKDKLQLQEQKINEAAPGKLQELITGKEYILEAIWNLDETKKHYDKLLLHTDEILEALESRWTALAHVGMLGETLVSVMLMY